MIKMFRFFFFVFLRFLENQTENRTAFLNCRWIRESETKENQTENREFRNSQKEKKIERDRKRFRALSPLISKLINRQRSEEPTVHWESPMRITNFLGENRNSERERVECWLSHKERERILKKKRRRRNQRNIILKK